MTRVVVHIERLVLRGFRYEGRHAVAQGLRQELAQAFGSADAVRDLASLGSVPWLRVADVRVEAGATPLHIGAQTARGIGGSIRS